MNAPHPPADIAIIGATLIDGTGADPVAADIAIKGDRISAIHPTRHGLGELAARMVIRADGLTLTPGFIDIHSHADYTLIADGRAESALRQGVTSVVTGNCGHGIAPCPTCAAPLVSMNIFGWRRRDGNHPTWESFGGYVEALRTGGVGVNVFPLVAHGALRLAVASFNPRPLTAAEKLSMRSMVREAMQEGAVGLSTGLEYAPGDVADTDEVIVAAEPLGDYDGFYATHCRNRTDRIADAAREAVTIAERSGARLQMSHFVRRPYGPGDCHVAAWQVLDEAQAKGLHVRADVFPFDYGPTPLAVLLPIELRQGSCDEIAARLQDRQIQHRLAKSLRGMFGAAVEAGLADSMFVACDGADGRWNGATLGQIARTLDATVPEVAVRLLAAAGPDFYSVAILEKWVEQADLDAALADPRFFIMGDGVTACSDGPLRDYAFSLSDWGYVPAFLGHHVRDRGLLPLPQAIAKMTSGPADQIGLKDRGRIAVGAKADLVLIELDAIGTSVAPSHAIHHPRGIRHVFVNGVAAVLNGELTQRLAGEVGRRPSAA